MGNLAVIGIDPGSPIYMAAISRSGRWIGHAGEHNVGGRDKFGFLNSPEKFAKVLSGWVDLYNKKGVELVIAIENVGPRTGEGITSAARFAGSVWMARTAAVILGVPYVMVAPQVWKRHFKLRKDKAASIDLATKLWPSREWRIKHKKDHNYAEAALIGRYVWEKENAVTGM